VPRRHRRPGGVGGGRARGLLGLEALESRTLLSFAAPANYDTGGLGAVTLAVGDFNGDGIPGLAVANSNAFNRGVPSVSVMLGLGDGTFRPLAAYDVGPHPISLATAAAPPGRGGRRSVPWGWGLRATGAGRAAAQARPGGPWVGGCCPA
jgi:hypothetical protein